MKRRRWLLTGSTLGAVLFVGCGAAVCSVVQPAASLPTEMPPRASAERLRRDVLMIVEGFGPRGDQQPRALDQIADYIAAEFEATGAQVFRQRYDGLTPVDGHPDGDYQNVIARFGPKPGPDVPLLIVGAHYDAADGLPGADDNASGTAGLLELARLLAEGPQLTRSIELVAYSTEEPPHFRTSQMGSAVHARKLVEAGTPVEMMISLEMIGRFDDRSGSQEFPAPGMGLIYPDRGNFIALVGKTGQGGLVRRSKSDFRHGSDLPVYSINAPTAVPGIDFSDHLNYWAADIPALMVTDTAFFRNHDYHTLDDTPDKLDYARMAQVVDGVHAMISLR